MGVDAASQGGGNIRKTGRRVKASKFVRCSAQGENRKRCERCTESRGAAGRKTVGEVTGSATCGSAPPWGTRDTPIGVGKGSLKGGSLEGDQSRRPVGVIEHKGTRWMSWCREAMKDAGTCDKPQGAGNQAAICGSLNGATHSKEYLTLNA